MRKHNFTKAFSMLELVFVIVVIGILVAVTLPRTDSNAVPIAATNLQSKIRYAQHLAMVDDKFGENATWYRLRWGITINNNGSYTISSLSPTGTTVYAKEAATGTSLQNVNLEGISSITLSGGCAGQSRISFDFLGRPLIGNLSGLNTAYTNASLLQNDCAITLSDGDTNQTITLVHESGYTYIDN